MAYCEIDGVFVYVPQEQLMSLKRQAAGSALEYARSMLNQKSAERVERKVCEHLRRLKSDDPAGFERDWLSLRLFGESAMRNLFWILTDYCEITGNGRLIDLRGGMQQITESRSGSDFDLPFGGYFAFEVPARGWPWHRPALQIHLCVDQVDKILGCFPTFRLYTESFDVQFDKHVTVFPDIRGKARRGEPGATDNPDDAQRN